MTLAPASQPQHMQVFQQVIKFCDSTLYGFKLKTILKGGHPRFLSTMLPPLHCYTSCLDKDQRPARFDMHHLTVVSLKTPHTATGGHKPCAKGVSV